jgi:hypothetical protein
MAARKDDLYRRDFYAWTRQQAAALRRLAETRPNVELDTENLVEEVESLGRTERRAVTSQLVRLSVHLLKLEHSPRREPRRGWLATVRDARNKALQALTPMIRGEVEPEIPTLYADARYIAQQQLAKHGETDAARTLPPDCPYTLDQLLDRDWLPANRHGLTDESL